MSPSVIKVLVAMAYPIAIEGIRHALQSASNIHIVAGVSLPNAIVHAAVSLHPDVILLDVDFTGTSPCQLIHDMRIAAPKSRIIAFTDWKPDDALLEIVREGCTAILGKGEPTRAIAESIRAAYEGHAWLSASVADAVIRQLPQGSAGRPVQVKGKPVSIKEQELTKTDRHLLSLIASGYVNKEIAGLLCMSESNVRKRIKTLCRKIGVADRISLTSYAIQTGLAHDAPEAVI